MDADPGDEAFSLSEEKRTEALECIERARQRQTNGDVDGAQGEVTNAWYALDEALTICPVNHRARFLLVSCAMNADDYTRAKAEALRIYHDLSEEQMAHLNDSVLHLSIAHASKMLCELEDAVRFATEATVIFKEDPQPYMVLGELNMAADDHGEAEQRFRQALMHHDSPACKHPLNEQNVYFTLCCLGASLTNQGKYSEAELFLRKAARQDPSMTLAFRHLVDVYHFQGRPLEAVQVAERVCEMDPADDEMRRKIEGIQEQQNPASGQASRQARRWSPKALADSELGGRELSGDLRSILGPAAGAKSPQRRQPSERGSIAPSEDRALSMPNPTPRSRRGRTDETTNHAGPPVRTKPAEKDGWLSFCCFDRDQNERR